MPPVSKNRKKEFRKEFNIEWDHHADRKLWNRAIELIDQPIPKRAVHCTVLGSFHGSRIAGSVTTASVALLHIRRAMLRHDWVLVRRLLANCYLDFHRSQRDTVHKIMFQILFSSPASNKKILKQFCRMCLGVQSEEDLNTFLKVVCTIPNKLPKGTTKITSSGNLYVINGTEVKQADAYTHAVKHMLLRNKIAQ